MVVPPWIDSPGTKRYVDGTHRTVPPDETVAWLDRARVTCGVTRVADITGLDHVGIPVALACRPNSRSLSVSQGKGLTLDAAKASALMEEARKEGLLIGKGGLYGNALRIAPPMLVSEAEIDEALAKLGRAMDRV